MIRATTLFLLLAATTLAAQPVRLPPLNISDTRIDAVVTFDPTRKVYTYDYTVICGNGNDVPIEAIRIDISGKTSRPQLDTDLRGNVRRFETRGLQAQLDTAIPVGITVPDPAEWIAGVGMRSEVGFGPGRLRSFAPGTTVTGIRLESKFPPNERRVVIVPRIDKWDEFVSQYPEGTVFTPESTEAAALKTTTYAPFEPVDSELFNGGGQSPANVNPFLRYAAPTESRTKLPVGTTKYTVVVFYGETTLPETFEATFNGVDVSSRFNPIPGSAQAVTFTLEPGSNKVQLSIDGRTASGRIATDTDTLTMLVP